MGWLSQRARGRVLACLAVVGAGGSAGLMVGMSAEPVQTSEISPAQIVAMRFPGDSRATDASRVAPAASGRGYVLASVEPDLEVSSLLFSPFPTYGAPPPPHAAAAAPSPATSSSVPRSPAPARPSLPPQLVSASPDLPAAALAYAA
ncbi:MAG: hypothetical protein ACXWJN_08145, partial [Methyloceanibacter sp.]